MDMQRCEWWGEIRLNSTYRSDHIMENTDAKLARLATDFVCACRIRGVRVENIVLYAFQESPRSVQCGFHAVMSFWCIQSKYIFHININDTLLVSLMCGYLSHLCN